MHMKSIVLACLGILLLLPLMVSGQGCRLSVTGTVQQPSCSGGMDGSIRLQLSGGTGAYTYVWNSGQEEKDIAQLMSGTYKVTVKDEQGCVGTAEFALSADTKVPGLQVRQRGISAGRKVLEVQFEGNIQPQTVYIKNLSEGVRAPQVAYSGQALVSGTYLLEAFTAAGCSIRQRVIIEAN